MCANQALPTVVLAVLLLGASSCSIKRFASGKVADALAGTGGTFASDEDVELVRAASPFGLKLMENVLESQPEHYDLLTALTRSFAQYSYAFVQIEGDEAEPVNLAAATVLHERARKLYLRAREYGLRALEVSQSGFRAEMERDARGAAQRVEHDDVEVLFWTSAAWGGALALSKERPELIADQPVLEALLDRALVLDEAFGRGALRALMISYEPSRIGGERGANDRARAHFQRAVELSAGLSATPYVSLAETVSVAEQKRAEFRELLARAIAIDVDRAPEWRVENLVQQRRARWLLARVDELFLE